MELTEYMIWGACMIGIGYTSYNIGFKEGMGEGVRMGAGLMWKNCWQKESHVNEILQFVQ